MNKLDPTHPWRRLYRPIEWVTLVIVIAAAVGMWFLPLSLQARSQFAGLIALSVLYVIAVFHWLIPRLGMRVWMHYVLMPINIVLVGAAFHMLYPYNIDILFVVVVAVTGIMAGSRVALLAAFLSTVADVGVSVLHADLTALSLVSKGFHFLVFLAAAYLAGMLVGIIRRQADADARHNQDLAFLLDVSRLASSSLNLDQVLPRLAEQIAKGFPVTLCRIALLDEDNESLVTYGVHALRALSGWQPAVGERWNARAFPLHWRALETRRILLAREDVPALALNDQERVTWFFNDVKSACLVPLVAESRALGVITLGEARGWQRQPFDQPKLDLLQTLGAQVAVIVQNARLHQTAQCQATRLAVLNQVARAVGSTIEMPDLLELIYQQLNRVIRTDTYYVALYDPRDDTIELRIHIDDGERFPPGKVPMGTGLVSLVIRDRKPLLVKHLSAELDTLPAKPIIVGKNRMSESWLGMPMIAGDHIIGLLSVASYQPYGFDEADVDLLRSVAEQVALALDNANHHAQVEEQSRRDSLTGAFNHGFLIAQLRDQVIRAPAGNRISLIMLDIDFFKQYNDQYGHVVGDQVLRLTVQAIQAHLKPTDSVGRWGGEEFAVILPDTTTAHARVVAERIRQTMAELKLTGSHGEFIPAPTVSQGIATFPDHADDADALVIVADRMLYQAKSGGRDQVAVAQARGA